MQKYCELPFWFLIFCPEVLSPPTWSNSAELGADDILTNQRANDAMELWVIQRSGSHNATHIECIVHILSFVFHIQFYYFVVVSSFMIRKKIFWSIKLTNVNSFPRYFFIFLFFSSKKSFLYMQRLKNISTCLCLITERKR